MQAHKAIPVGISTKLGVIFAVVAALKPIVDQIIALVENTNANWTQADKIGLVSAAVIAGVTIISRGAQAVVAILKGN